MTKVYDKDGKEYEVVHDIDVAEWIAAGYTLEKGKKSTAKTTEE